jgi:hypothetical protein
MKQNALPLLGQLKTQIVELDPALVAHCENYKQAVKLCMECSRTYYLRSDWAGKLGMCPGSLSTILDEGDEKRKRNLNPSLFTLIQQIAGNKAIAQFFEMELSGELNHQRPTEEQELLERLAQVRSKQ